MKNVLVLCTGNSCRSIMAEALINHLSAGSYKAVSAGSDPTGEVHPKSIETLERHGIPVHEPRSKSWDEFEGTNFDLVITVCDAAAGQSCPIFLGKHKKLHWSTPDPAAATGSEEDIIAAFDEAFAMLKERVEGRLLQVDDLLEKLTCLRFAHMDMQSAIRSIQTAKGQADKKVIYPILQSAIVSYAKPFTKCQITKNIRKPLLDQGEFILPANKELHKELMEYRNSFVAHTDITTRSPKFSHWNKKGEQPFFPMSFKNCQIEYWCNNIDKIESLINTIKEQILEQTQTHEKRLDAILHD